MSNTIGENIYNLFPYPNQSPQLMICCKTGAVLLVDVLPKIPILSIPWWWPSWQLHHLGNRFSTIPQRWNSNGLADGGKKQWDRCYKPTQLPPDCFSPFVGWKNEHHDDDDDDDDESWKFVVANHFWRMTPEISGANIMLVLDSFRDGIRSYSEEIGKILAKSP